MLQCDKTAWEWLHVVHNIFSWRSQLIPRAKSRSQEADELTNLQECPIIIRRAMAAARQRTSETERENTNTLTPRYERYVVPSTRRSHAHAYAACNSSIGEGDNTTGLHFVARKKHFYARGGKRPAKQRGRARRSQRVTAQHEGRVCD